MNDPAPTQHDHPPTVVFAVPPSGGVGRKLRQKHFAVFTDEAIFQRVTMNARTPPTGLELLDLMFQEQMILDLQAEQAIEQQGAPPPTARRMKRRHRLRPLAVRRREMARLLSISTSTLTRWDAAGATPPSVTIRGMKLWPMESLRLWLRWDCPSRAEFERRLQTTKTPRRTNADQAG